MVPAEIAGKESEQDGEGRDAPRALQVASRGRSRRSAAATSAASRAISVSSTFRPERVRR